MIDEIISLLEDGQWHSFTEIKENYSLSEAEFQNIMAFLEKFEFVYVNEKEEKAKLDASLLELST